MELSGSTALVTGAGGFIGSHLVEALLRVGSTVKAFVRYNSRNDFGQLEELKSKLKDLEVITGDLRDPQTVRRAAADCDIIFHLGALVGIPYSYLNPADAFATNVGGTQNVLDAARDHGKAKVVVTSTSEVFGTPLYVPIDEKHPLQAQSPYAASKIAADKLAESYYLSYDLPVATLRPFNTYGPRQSARAIIPTIAAQALQGASIHMGALDISRDFLFVEDTVAGFIATARHESTIGKVINIGSGCSISVGQLSELIISLLDVKVKIVLDRNRLRPEKSEIPRLLCNYSLAKELIGWEPGYSLEDGLTKTLDWIKDHLNTYKAEIYNV